LSVTVFITQDVLCNITLSVLVSPVAGTPKFVYTVGQKVGSISVMRMRSINQSIYLQI